jgi:hypothetical protein
MHQPLSMHGQVSVHVEDWEIHLHVVIRGDVPYLDLTSLTALHGQTVQVVLGNADAVRDKHGVGTLLLAGL